MLPRSKELCSENLVELTATSFWGKTDADGEILFLPKIGSLVGPEDYKIICAWSFTLEVYQVVLSDTPPFPERQTDGYVRRSTTYCHNRKDEFFRVLSHLKNVGDSVVEDEIVAILQTIPSPENEIDWREVPKKKWGPVLPYSKATFRKANQLDVDIEKITPTGSAGEVTERDVSDAWRKQFQIKDDY